MKKLSSGTKTPVSGQYVVVDPNGKRGVERTSVKGKPLPPTPKSGDRYILIDPTKTRNTR